jgi:argininosuccinate lyase
VRLWLSEAVNSALENLHALMIALVDAASRDPDAVIPGYTHLRRAQAVLPPIR